MNSSAITDKKTLVNLIKTELEPTRSSLNTTPDMAWITPLVRDILFDEVLIYCRGNQSKAAKMLGLNRGTYRKYISDYRSW